MSILKLGANHTGVLTINPLGSFLFPRRPLPTTHLSRSNERGLGSATCSGIAPSSFCAPRGRRCGRSRSSGGLARWRRPSGNTRGRGSGCETGRTSGWSLSASPRTGGCGNASGSASRSASSAGTASDGAFGSETWSGSPARAGCGSGTTTGSRRWNGTESGSWRPTMVGCTGPNSRTRARPWAANSATGRSRSWTSRPAANLSTNIPSLSS